VRRELARKGLLPLERAFRLLTRSRPLPGVGTFLLSIHPYRGRAVELPDGTAVRPGAAVGEIHFWNERIAAGYATAADRELLWRFKRDLEADLRRLAALQAAGELRPDPVAFFGVTPMARIAGRLGFTSVPLPPDLPLRAITSWQRLLGRVFRPVGRQRQAAVLSAACWISREELRRRFGGGGG
jgi:hypothetical protein